MAVIHDYACATCGAFFADCWNDDPPVCCGAEASIAYTKVNSFEWGGPRVYEHLRDEPFSSRSELKAWTEANGMALGASAEKHGGARNEEHINTGKLYSDMGSPKH